MKLAVRVKKNLALSLAIVTAMGMQVSTMASDYDNHWANTTIKEWIDYGVVKGYDDGSFKPNSPITRSELAVVIAEVFGLQAPTKNTSYIDVKDGAWYQEAINKVTEAGIMQGSGNQFNPSAAITRQEVAVALTNAYKVTTSVSPKSFKDDDKIASWAKQAVNSLAAQNYISGREDGRFDPQSNITRAELVSILDRLTGTLYNEAGSYTGEQKGNILINIQDVILEDMIIHGNLFIAQGVGRGDATLKNVTVKGETFIAGGGINSIKMYQSVLDNGAKVLSTEPIRIVSEGGKSSIYAGEGVSMILTGSFNKVELSAGVKVEFKAATVEDLKIVSSKILGDIAAEVKLDASTTIKKVEANAPTAITGDGKITELVINVEKVNSSIIATTHTIKEGIKAIIGGKEVTSETVKDITLATKPSTGGGGGGGTDTGVTPETTKKITGVEVAFSNAASQSYATKDGNIIFNLPQLIEDSVGTNRVSSITVKGDAGKLTTSHTDIVLEVNKAYGIQDIISLFKKDLIQAKELLKLAKPEKADAIEKLYRDAEERLSNNKDVSIQAIVDEYKLLAEKAQNNGFNLPSQYTKSGTYTASDGKTTTLNLTIQFN